MARGHLKRSPTQRGGLALALLASVAALPGAAQPGAVHKCRLADGSVAFQDQPCAGEALPAPVIAPAPAYRPPLAPPARPATRPSRAATPVPNTALPPLPSFFRCTDFEGNSRVTGTPDRRGRYVPLWVLDRFAAPLSGAVTGGTHSLGVAGALHTFVEDDCRPMARAELCIHWRARLLEVDKRVLDTFFDERRAFEGEQASLREWIRTFC